MRALYACYFFANVKIMSFIKKEFRVSCSAGIDKLDQIVRERLMF
jgi:hypothetical protein